MKSLFAKANALLHAVAAVWLFADGMMAGPAATLLACAWLALIYSEIVDRA